MHSETLRCGLLGRTLGHSYSPAIHAQLAGYSYLYMKRSRRSWRAFCAPGNLTV